MNTTEDQEFGKVVREIVTVANFAGMRVAVRFQDCEKGARWRLEWREEVSLWSQSYSGILTHTFSNGRTFATVTDYWSGSLPPEKPFEIVGGSLEKVDENEFKN